MRLSRVWKRRLLFGFVVFLIALVPTLAVYASWIEPYWIEVTHHRVAGPLRTPLKIAHITDLHTSRLGRREHQVLQVLDAERPDLIVITGDSISITSDYPAFREVLSQLHYFIHRFTLKRQRGDATWRCRVIVTEDKCGC